MKSRYGVSLGGVNFEDLTSVKALANSLATRLEPQVVYKHPDRENYNITFKSTYLRQGNNPAWIVYETTGK